MVGSSGWLVAAGRQDGTIAVIAALVLAAMIMILALTVDLGLAFFSERRLQAATDAAAMSAAQNPANAATRVSNILAANGFASATVVSLTTGAYQPDPAVAASSRFTAGGNPTDAVELVTSWPSPLFFARAMVSDNSVLIQAKAGAAEINEAGLVAGSGLVNIDNGLINAIIGGLTGSSLSLTSFQYQGLANTNINALDFLDALAGQANITSGTYGQVLNGGLTVQAVVAAAASALNQEAQYSSDSLTALQALNILGTEITASTTIPLGTLLDAGFWQNARIGSIDRNSVLQANLNLYLLTTFAAQIAGGSNYLSLTNVLAIPGVATIDLGLTLRPPASGAYFAVGPVGATVHTSVVRLLLTARLLSSLSLGLSSAPVNLPIYGEIAEGTATVSGIACGTDPANDSTVQVSAQSGLANVYVGSVTPAMMTNFSRQVTVGPAVIVNAAGIARITGSAQVTVLGGAATLTFTQPQILSGTSQTASGTGTGSTFGQGLSANLQLQVTLLGVPLPVDPLPNLTALLKPVFAAVDGLLDATLRTLGVRAGYLDVTVTGTRCGVPALIE
jgi:uncharacterized membrane protein